MNQCFNIVLSAMQISTPRKFHHAAISNYTRYIIDYFGIPSAATDRDLIKFPPLPRQRASSAHKINSGRPEIANDCNLISKHSLEISPHFHYFQILRMI